MAYTSALFDTSRSSARPATTRKRVRRRQRNGAKITKKLQCSRLRTRPCSDDKWTTDRLLLGIDQLDGAVPDLSIPRRELTARHQGGSGNSDEERGYCPTCQRCARGLTVDHVNPFRPLQVNTLYSRSSARKRQPERPFMWLRIVPPRAFAFCADFAFSALFRLARARRTSGCSSDPDAAA